MPDEPQPPARPAQPRGRDDTEQIPRLDDVGDDATQTFAPVPDGPAGAAQAAPPSSGPPPWGSGSWSPPPPAPVPTPVRADVSAAPRRSATVPVLAGGLALVLGLAGVFAYLAVTASGKLDRTRVRLTSAQDRADTVTDELARTRARLEETQESLADARRRADSAEGDLSAVEETNAAQRQLISDLQVCLDGVLVSMQALGEDDAERAQAELARVKPSCDRAYAQAESLDA